MSPHKPTPEDLQNAEGKRIPDVLADQLDVLLVGINPSLYSAAVGHHFARPGNRFWPALHLGGFTPRLYSPREDRQLVDLGYGLTNITARATARADQLSSDELRVGARRLRAKVVRRQIRCVAFLGITAYRTAYGRKDAVMGRQEECIGETVLWVLPNPSGLNAHYQLPDLARLFRELRQELEFTL